MASYGVTLNIRKRVKREPHSIKFTQREWDTIRSKKREYGYAGISMAEWFCILTGTKKEVEEIAERVYGKPKRANR